MDFALDEGLAAVRAAHGDRWTYIGPNDPAEPLHGWRASRLTEDDATHHIVTRYVHQLATALDREKTAIRPPATTE